MGKWQSSKHSLVICLPGVAQAARPVQWQCCLAACVHEHIRYMCCADVCCMSQQGQQGVCDTLHGDGLTYTAVSEAEAF